MVDLRRSPDERLPIPGGNPEAVARVVNRLVDGQSANVGNVTLASGTTSTVIRAPIFRASTVLVLVPRSSAAAAISWWQETNADKGAITIGHSAPGADVPFSWLAVG